MYDVYHSHELQSSTLRLSLRFSWNFQNIRASRVEYYSHFNDLHVRFYFIQVIWWCVLGGEGMFYWRKQRLLAEHTTNVPSHPFAIQIMHFKLINYPPSNSQRKSNIFSHWYVSLFMYIYKWTLLSHTIFVSRHFVQTTQIFLLLNKYFHVFFGFN